MVRPRLESKRRRSAQNYGDEVADLARTYLGYELTPWQRYAAERATEYDHRGLLWPTVVLTIARGQGKSWWLQAMALWRLMSGHRFGGKQEIVSTAQKIEVARLSWETVALAVKDRGAAQKVSSGRGVECLVTADGSTWRILAPRLSSTTGYRAHMVVVDEAWSVAREVVEQGFMPQMRRREQTQLFIVSTAGDGTSDLLTRMRERALSGDGRTLLLEWSAPPEAAPGHPHTWQYANPDWDKGAEAQLAQLYQSTPENIFRSQYLNQWVKSVDGIIPISVWNRCLSTAAPLDNRGVIVVDSSYDGNTWSAVLAAPTTDNRIAVRSVRTDKPPALWQWVRARSAGRRIIIGASLDGLQPSGITKSGTFLARQTRDYLPGVRKMLADGMIAHDGDAVLTEHILSATTVKTHNGEQLRLGSGDFDLAKLLVIAVGMATRSNKMPVVL